jgi:hypothetical protein
MHCTQLRSCCSFVFEDFDDFEVLDELEPLRLATPEEAPEDPPQAERSSAPEAANATRSARRCRPTTTVLSVRDRTHRRTALSQRGGSTLAGTGERDLVPR